MFWFASPATDHRSDRPHASRRSWELSQRLKADDREPWVRLRIDTTKLPSDVVFYPDPEAKSGVWTYQAIPPEAIMAPEPSDYFFD
jgi:hypothetical protein